VTAATGPFTSHPVSEAEEERSLLHGPREGWSVLVLLVLMVVTAALAVDDANWAGFTAQGGHQTGFLPLGALLAVLVGFGLAKSGRLQTFMAHLIGATIGAAFLLVAVSGSISTSPDVPGRLRDLNESVAVFYEDLVILGIRSSETSVFLLIIGALLWGLGQFAAFNVFRRGRAMPAVIGTGLVLLINMSITVRVQYLHLVVLAATAMLLLVRMNLLTQREGWRRRRIGDAGYVSGLFMRGSLAFVAFTLVGSLTLAATASSAPLANAWRDVDDQRDLGVVDRRRLPGDLQRASGLLLEGRHVRSLRRLHLAAARSSATRGPRWRGTAGHELRQHHRGCRSS
jgi:hypothetical protein